MSTFVFWLMAIVPAVVFPFLLYAYARRFGQRRELIRSLLTNSEAIELYSVAFRTDKDLQSDEWKRRLNLDIESYLYPAMLCSILTIAGMVAVLSVHTKNALHLPAGLFEYVSRTPLAAIGGFSGAYVWALYDFTDRFRILNLPTNAIHSMWFRMVLAPLAASFAAAAFAKGLEPLIGFGIGMLPTAAILAWVQDTARQRMGIAATKDVPPQWEYVQGLTPDIIARLVEASVTSAVHLANQDPVNLLRRTNIEWRNILDMMDQAYLLGYVGPSLEKLRPLGVRGAIEAAILYERLLTETDPAGEAHATLEAFAEHLGIKPIVARNFLRNLYEDPQVRLLWKLWFDPAATPSPTDQEVNPENVKKEPPEPPRDGGKTNE